MYFGIQVNKKKERACYGIRFKKNSFFDQRFQKFKVGGEWYFLAKETKAFLLNWLTENEV
ncbi:hypothetical protein ABH955_005725 [Bacillus sp. RC240]